MAAGPPAARALTERVVIQVARLVSMGQLPSGRAERLRKSMAAAATGWSCCPAAIRDIVTKLVSGVASRNPPPVGWIWVRTRRTRFVVTPRRTRVSGLRLGRLRWRARPIEIIAGRA